MKRNICLYYEKYKEQIYFWGGLLIALFLCSAYFLIGKRSYVQVHDQLDGEVLNYIYQAKYLFSDIDIIPEFMNGMHKSSMTPPAPIGVLFYKLLPPFWAYAAMHVFVVLTGYVGTFLLIKQMTKHPIIPFMAACFFVYLPFYPVYGLSIMGQPLLLWALWQLYQDAPKKWLYYFCIFLYAVSSSLALVGYAWIGLLLLFIILLLFQHKRVKEMVIAWIVLCATYLLCNMQLVCSVLGIGGETYPLHREEMAVYAIDDLIAYFGKVFTNGIDYAEANNGVIVLLALVVLIGYPILQRLKQQRKASISYRLLMGLLLGCVIITVIICAWRSPWIVDLRLKQGGIIKYFQADRIGWILPVCWYMILALCMQIILDEWKKLRAVRYLVVVAVVAYLGNAIYLDSTIYHNLRLMIFPDTYHLMTWDDFYAGDVYEQIEEYIGEDKSSYRTLSLGITPAAALYNGFYCLDGYSNVYSLEYKHAFREIIEKELEKVEETRLYFDSWGNRCYLLNSETGNYMLIDKHNAGSYQKLELNMAKAYEMGARYLFAAIPIENAEELGLVLMREEPFSTAESYFEVWLYEIKAP